MTDRELFLLVVAVFFMTFFCDTVSFRICSYLQRKKHKADVEVLPDGTNYAYFCSKCQDTIDRFPYWTYEDDLSKSVLYCKKCGRKLNWSNVDSFGSVKIKPFGTGKTLAAKYKFLKKEEKVINESK